MGGRAGRFSTAAIAHLEDAVSPLLFRLVYHH